jgi:hypothetical protein
MPAAGARSYAALAPMRRGCGAILVLQRQLDVQRRCTAVLFFRAMEGAT